MPRISLEEGNYNILLTYFSQIKESVVCTFRVRIESS